MPFTSTIGTIFNCGFCHTFVYWYYSDFDSMLGKLKLEGWTKFELVVILPLRFFSLLTNGREFSLPQHTIAR